MSGALYGIQHVISSKNIIPSNRFLVDGIKEFVYGTSRQESMWLSL